MLIINTIAMRELRALFLSPLAWAILAVVEVISAWLFLSQVDIYIQLQPRLAALQSAPGVSDLVVAPTLASVAIILLLVTPLITMRVISEERRNGTLSLLRSAPISTTQIVLGKYIGLLGFVLILLALIALMPLSLMLTGGIDLGKFAAGMLGLGLIVSTFVAVGLFMSSITEQPTVAAIGSFGLLLLLWMINLAGETGTGGVLEYLSLLSHLQNMLQGLIRSSDIAYYLLCSTLFLGLSVHRLEAQRLGAKQ